MRIFTNAKFFYASFASLVCLAACAGQYYANVLSFGPSSPFITMLGDGEFNIEKGATINGVSFESTRYANVYAAIDSLGSQELKDKVLNPEEFRLNGELSMNNNVIHISAPKKKSNNDNSKNESGSESS